VAGHWRRLHNEELRNLYASPNIICDTESKKMRWMWHVARTGEMNDVPKILTGKPQSKRPLGRPRRRWKDNTRMDLWEIRW
jgi:hypothetical protein